MKKILMILYGVLFVVAAVLLWNNRAGPYMAERTLWHLSQEYDAIVKNPTGTPTRKYEQVLEKFGKYIRTYSPQRVSAVAHIMRARLLTVQNKHDQAKEGLDSALTVFKDNEAIVIQLLLEQAQMYAIQENSEGVSEIYQRIIQEHTLNRYGMQGPLILAKYYVNKRDAVGAKQAYIAAIEHYRRLMQQYPDSQVEFQSRLLLAESYKSLADWDKTLELQKETLLKFARPDFWSPESLLYVVQSINTITVLQRKDFVTPVEIYTSFIKKYPGHPFNEDLAETIRQIQYMESQAIPAGPIQDGESSPEVATTP